MVVRRQPKGCLRRLQGVVMIEVMIPFPSVFFDVEDEVCRRKKKRTDQRSALTRISIYK